MKTVVYNASTFKVLRVTDEDIDIVTLPQDQDFMPVDLWNQSDDKKRFPTIEV